MNPIVHTVYLSKFHHTGLCCLCKHCLIAMQADLHIAAVVLPGQPGIILGFSLIDTERRSLFFLFSSAVVLTFCPASATSGCRLSCVLLCPTSACSTSKHVRFNEIQQQEGVFSAHSSMCYRTSRAVTSSQMTAVAQGMQQGLFLA